MFSLGPGEIAMIGAVALVLFGPGPRPPWRWRPETTKGEKPAKDPYTFKKDDKPTSIDRSET